MDKRKPTEQQQADWFEDRTTAYFFYLLSEMEDEVSEKLRHQEYAEASPSVLQSQRANLFGFLGVYENLAEVFKSQSFMELEDAGSEQGSESAG